MAALQVSRPPFWRSAGKALSIAYKGLLALFLAWIFAYNVLHIPYKLGTDGQKVRCLPWSIFLIKVEPPSVIQPGDLVYFRTAGVGRGFDAYPWVKMVGAVPGDYVEIKADRLFINGQLRDELWLIKPLGEKAGTFDKSFVVPDGEYFVIGTTRESYDSRYWGTIKKEQIIGSAYPLF